jgi:hypothetical protein
MITAEMNKAARDAYHAELPEALYPSGFAMEAALTAALALLPGQPVAWVSQSLIDTLKIGSSDAVYGAEVSNIKFLKFTVSLYAKPPAAVQEPEPVAWRWSFDEGESWHFGTFTPGHFRFGNPDNFEPLYAAAPKLLKAEGHAVAPEPEGFVVWYDPTRDLNAMRPRKVIDASIGFLEAAELGTKLYTSPQLAAVQEPVAVKMTPDMLMAAKEQMELAGFYSPPADVWDRAFTAALSEYQSDPAPEIAALRDYALAATKTITGLAGGASELFAGQIGDMFKADLQVCASKVHDRHAKMHGLLVKSKKDADAFRAENERLREALIDLINAAEEDFGVPSDNDEDNEPVGGSLKADGSPDPMAITFGHMRRARAAVALRTTEEKEERE